MPLRPYPIFCLVIVCCGFAFRSPMLHSGFLVDDYAQLSMMQGQFHTPRAPLDLFTFVDGTTEDNTALRSVGYLPWWSDPGLKVSLFRPLASALMWLDLAYFGLDARGYHLHSAAWWLVMMLALALLLRRLLPPGPALLAFALCAAHPVHSVFFGWIASRNAIVAATFCMFGLWAQLRAGQDGHRRGNAIALACYALALSAGEYAVMFLAYAAVYALTRPAASAPRRRQLLAMGVAAVVYVGLRAAFGFGSNGSAMYIDPVREPDALLAAMPVRWPILASDFVFALRGNWWHDGLPWAEWLSEQLRLLLLLDVELWRTSQVVLGYVALALAALLAWRAQAAAGLSQGESARFMALGLPCAIIPALCTYPEDRLLLPIMLGWSVVLIQAGRAALASLRVRRSVVAYAQLTLVSVLLVVGSLVRLFYTAPEQSISPRIAIAIRNSILDPALDPVFAGAERVLLLGAADPTTTIYVPLVRRIYGRPGPAECQLLSSTTARLLLSRVDEHTFILSRMQRAYSGLDFYASVFNRRPLTVDQRAELPGMHVAIDGVDRGRAMRVRYQLERSLDDPRVVLLTQTESGLKRVTFPPIGRSIVMDRPRLPAKLMPSAL